MVEQPQRLQWGDGTTQRRGQQQQVVVERKRKKNKNRGKVSTGRVNEGTQGERATL
jgi:hypothetical protein